MADLNNLLGELEEQEEFLDPSIDDQEDDEEGNTYAKNPAGRPSLAETEATEPMMSEDWESPTRRVDIPAALQEAAKRRRDETEAWDGREAEEDAGDPSHSREVEDTGEGLDFDLGGSLFEDDVAVEANELYQRLQYCWHQERQCPELLQYDDEMVERVKEQLIERQEWIDETNAAASDGQHNTREASVQTLMATMAEVDLDRIKYVLSSWLAERLSKIEAHPLHMRDKIDHLSDAELEYLKGYGSLLEEHLRRTVLDNIPEAWQALDEPQMIDQPDYDGYHFWLVQETIDADGVEQEEGSCLVAKYKEMREYMMEGKVTLQL